MPPAGRRGSSRSLPSRGESSENVSLRNANHANATRLSHKATPEENPRERPARRPRRVSVPSHPKSEPSSGPTVFGCAGAQSMNTRRLRTAVGIDAPTMIALQDRLRDGLGATVGIDVRPLIALQDCTRIRRAQPVEDAWQPRAGELSRLPPAGP